jgi:Sec-independent protein translocase protein TatA
MMHTLHGLASAGHPLALLDIGPIELLILVAAAVMLFGGDLPDMARRAGHVVGRLRASAAELTRDVEPPQDLGSLPTLGEDMPGPDEQDKAPLPGDPHAPSPASHQSATEGPPEERSADEDAQDGGSRPAPTH